MPLLMAVKQDARAYSSREKWLFTATVSFAAAVAPLGSAMLMRPSISELLICHGQD